MSDWGSIRSEAASDLSRSFSRGHIERIEVNNFKSYHGHQVIGPFSNFTAVIGPNGAGKSNLMDCISFVLAVKTTQLRGNQLKDLIYKVSGERTQSRSAWVKMIYKHGQDGEDETEFHRGINATGTGVSEYKVNQRTVSLQEYENHLSRIGVLVKVRNFLVFQGEVEQLAQTSPARLTELFEKISGSGALKEEYEKLKAEKERGEEDAIFSMQKKKGLQSEKRQVAAQKEEAEKYANLIQDQEELRTLLYLFDLYFTEQEVDKLKNEISEKKSDLEAIQARHSRADAKLKTAKQESASLHKKLIKAEKGVAQDARNLDEEKTKHIKLREETAFLVSKADKLAKQLQRGEKELKKHKAERERVEQEIADVDMKLQALESVGESQQEIELGAEDMKTYTKLREESNSKTFHLRQDLESIEREQQNNRQELHNLRVSEGEFKHQLEGAEKEIAEIDDKLAKLEEADVQRAASLVEKQKELEESKSAERNGKSRDIELRVKLEKIHEQLRDARIDRRESERSKKRTEMVEALQRVFPGVYGRVSDLCAPSSRKYNVAVTVTIGKDMDSIIVDTNETCRSCVQYLRDQRAGVATFIPLDTIKVKPEDDALRTLGGSSKLVLDILDYDRKYEKAMRYVCGDTLVFDTISEARAVCLGQGRRRRGVTLDGTKIEKSGVMTGGITGVEQKAARWDQNEVERLKAMREKCDRELSGLSKQRLTEKIQVLISEIDGLQKKKQYSDIDVNEMKDKLKVLAKTKTAATKQIRDLSPRMNTLTSALESREQRIATLKDDIARIEDSVFSDFSSTIGVRNIREYENRVLTKQTERAEEMRKLNTQRSQLVSKLEYENSKDRQVSMDKLQKEHANASEQLEKVKQKEEDQREAVGELQEVVKEKHAQITQIRTEKDVKDSEVKALKKEANSEWSVEQELVKDINTLETQLERKRAHRMATLHTARLEDITIPFLQADGEPAQKKRKKQKSESQASESFSMSEGSDSQGKSVQIDFSLLPDEYQDCDKKKYEELKADLRQQLKRIHEDLENMAPNLKAADKLDEVDDRLKSSNDEFGASRLRAREATLKFNAKKEERYRLFMRAFNHISQNIDRIYKDLTKTPGNHSEMGGTAYLTLEDIEEPYNSGIKYNAMPPLKRFRDMEQLSGGEKTVAAVALLFAIHDFHPSPFFVLDEVDAALDQSNVNKVAAYIASRSNDFQCIVISLKEAFYEKSHSLVGIYRDQDHNCSKTLSLDLSSYE